MANNSRKFRFATKTEVKAETPEVSIDPRNLPHHPGIAKAWLKITLSGSTVTLAASYNISSITDNGTGDFTANFITPFSSAHYCATGLVAMDGGEVAVNIIQNSTTEAPTASTFRFYTFRELDRAALDADAAYVAFFGDQ